MYQFKWTIFLGAVLPILADANISATCQEVGEVQVEKKSITLDSQEVPYELGVIYVPENRSEAESRLIGVSFVRFKAAVDSTTVPPVFRLPGGPGGTFVSTFDSYNDSQLMRMFPELVELREVCDVVYVDQRGFSEGGDRFVEWFESPVRPKDRPLTLEDEVQDFKEQAKAIVTQYEEKGVDLRGYTVKECANDVSDLAGALGYEKITLCGTSFGSQWSFAIMRLHPDLVERALLSGVEPLNHGFDMPSHVFAAVRRIWKTVDEDRRFEKYLPPGGMGEAARILIERLEREPVKLFFEVESEEEPQLVGVLGPEDFPWNDPVRVLELFHEQYDRYEYQFKVRPRSRRNLPIIGPLIDSSLSVTPERRHQLWTDPAVRYLGRDNFALYLATDEIWPSPDVGDDFRTPVLCDIPVVFAQGDWDFQTPIENCYEIAPFFPNSRVLIAHRGGHGVIQPIARQNPEVWDELIEFLCTGDMENIPERVHLSPSQRYRAPTFDVQEE